MELFDPIGKLRDRGFDVNNVAIAVSQATSWEATKSEYEQVVFEVTGKYIHTEFDEQAKQLFVNFVNQAVRLHSVDEEAELNTIRIIMSSKASAEQYFSIFRSKIPEGKSVRWRDASAFELAALREQHKKTYVRPRSKQDRAIDIVKSNPTATNKQLQERFQKELQLTPNGAATYVYNVRRLLK